MIKMRNFDFENGSTALGGPRGATMVGAERKILKIWSL
jgi:hypothetical protein